MDPQYSTVFAQKQNGYYSFRIPAMIVSKKGTVLVFAEARRFKMDQASNDIVLKISIRDVV